MLTFSLNLQWDKTVNRWMVVSSQVNEPAGTEDPSDITDIHVMNLALSQVLKIFEALDAPIVATTMEVVPGQVIANSVSATVLS